MTLAGRCVHFPSSYSWAPNPRRGVMGERRGSVQSRNMYEGPMDMDNRVETDCMGVGGVGESNRGKIGTTVIEQQ